MDFKQLAAAGTLLVGFSSATLAGEEAKCIEGPAPSKIDFITPVTSTDVEQNPQQFVAFKTCDGQTRHISVEDLIKASTDGKVPVHHQTVKTEISNDIVPMKIEPGLQ